MMDGYRVVTRKIYTSPQAIKQVKKRIDSLMAISHRLADQGKIEQSDRVYDSARSLEGHLPWPEKSKILVKRARLHPRVEAAIVRICNRGV